MCCFLVQLSNPCIPSEQLAQTSATAGRDEGWKEVAVVVALALMVAEVMWVEL